MRKKRGQRGQNRLIKTALIMMMIIMIIVVVIWGRWGVPSRNILHVRSRGSKSRFRVADGFGWRAPKTYFEKSKVVEVRPILTSSGTLFFWRRACELHRLFWKLSHFKTFIKLIRFEQKQQIGRTAVPQKRASPRRLELAVVPHLF